MKFLEELINVLSVDERFVGENNQIIKTKVSDAAKGNDRLLLKALLGNEMLRESFFTKVDDIYVFDKNKFVWVLESKEFLPDSYTMYKNKIGLVDVQNNLISQRQDVSLVWPYKDCILKGGQTKEDQKRNEIFYNEILSPNQVNRLLEPKAFGNAKRYIFGGVEDDIEFNEGDNLIIKGNNLIALSSLLKKYKGRVKLIYIDPPYNTSEDSFKYNDKFSRSSWLVFMKNRLEIAKKLICKEGVIIVQISFHEHAYLKILMNDIFGEKNSLLDFNVLVRHPDRSLTADKKFNDVVEYALCYSKDENYDMPKREKEKTNEEYIFEIDLPEDADAEIDMDGKTVKVYLPDNTKIKKVSGHELGLKSISIRGSIREKNSSGRFYVKHLEKLIGEYPKGTIFAVPNMGDDIHDYRIFELPTGNNINGKYYQGKPLSSEVTLIPYSNYLNYLDDYNSVNDEGDVSFRNGKKPEAYIKNYLEIFTEPNDLVLDFFMGSGTTQAVALKMNRRFIGIEQMDYIEDVSIERLKRVISGEQGGISKDVNWQGGGSFVYCQILEDNQTLINEVQHASDSKTIKVILERATKNGKIIPSVLPKDLESSEEDFDKMSLNEQKTLVLELLDKNKLYVNLSDLEDEDIEVSVADKEFTRSFYGLD